MYQTHWGFSETPFRSQLDPRFFYESPTHREALARLNFLVERQRRLGLLLGAGGSGKSLLLEVFAGQTRRQGLPTARVNLLGLTADEFLWQLAAEFGLNPGRGLPWSTLWPMLTDRLVEYRYCRLSTVILLDNADQADDQVLAQTARLCQIDQAADSRLTILVAGRPERVSRLPQTLLERSELRIDIEPWAPSDTADFLETALSKAGGRSGLFNSPAVARLHELTDGVPRRVSQLADLALLAGAGGNLHQIDADTVDSVHRELGAIEV